MPFEGNCLIKRRVKNGSFIDDVPKSRSTHDCLLGVNEKLLLNGVDGEKSFGWYSSRRAYRSVAYKTWTVGAARKLLTKSLTINRNGFISDSDSALEDESIRPVYVSSKALSSSRESSELRPKSESRRENGMVNLQTNQSTNRVRFDRKTELDLEFRAVIDTFKDLQNFITASKSGAKNKLYFEEKRRPDNFINCSKCSDHKFKRRDSNLWRDRLSDNDSNLDFSESFDNAGQAIRYLTEELNNLRRRDISLLQTLKDIKIEMQSKSNDCLDSNILCNCNSLDLPPIPSCLKIKK